MKDQQINSFTIHLSEQLGRGAFGTIWNATDSDQNLCAAKQISKSDLHEKFDFERAVNNYKMISKEFTHPNLVDIIDSFIDDGFFWIIMERCSEKDLDKFYRNYRSFFVEENVPSLLQQLAQAVQYLHTREVAHRDIKPYNILVHCQEETSEFKRMVFKLGDFDLIKHFRTDIMSAETGTDVGTPSFKSPEFFDKKSTKPSYHGFQVDIFSMGLTILAVLQAAIGHVGGDSVHAVHLKPSIDFPDEDVKEEEDRAIGKIMFEKHKRNPTGNDLKLVQIEQTDSDIVKVLKELVERTAVRDASKRLTADDVLKYFFKVSLHLITSEPRP